MADPALSWAHAIIDTLVHHGVDTFCVAPGSRSTPLTLIAARHPGVTTHVHYDERGLGFFALGIAKASEKPVAIITTSGTAVANLLPAVIEAKQSQVPLIILSADRPPELVGVGANQAIDQQGIFGTAVVHEQCLPVPTPAISLSFVVSTVMQSLLHAQFPQAGPVQLNCPFREPFTFHSDDLPDVPRQKLALPSMAQPPHVLAEVQAFLEGAKAGVVVLGALASVSEAEAVQAFISQLPWPVLVDVGSHLRFTKLDNAIYCSDAAVPILAESDCDAVLYLGQRLLSKSLTQWLSSVSAPVLHLSNSTALQDPFSGLPSRCLMSLKHLSQLPLTEVSESALLKPFRVADQALLSQHARSLDSAVTLTEPMVATELSSCLTPEMLLFAGNSMPIRLLANYALPKQVGLLPTFCNRGASGIDGLVATSAGLVSALNRPAVLLIGDLSLLHDCASLGLCKNLPKPLHIVVINNDGGGIFEKLPVFQQKDIFDRFFKTPHGFSFSGLATQFNLAYDSCHKLNSLFNQFTSQLSFQKSTLTEICIK